VWQVLFRRRATEFRFPIVRRVPVLWLITGTLTLSNQSF